ncbi:DUF4292 domain-containing protein [Gracilimonas sp.]|uniref:DUF4292 domain-containing protein n=1 Tax=Gracilimonas sp. TaxID=1974203 RepID=UPI0028728554|nr:DUF4292 domain-containing protein [Gracilimonas sp.]
MNLRSRLFLCLITGAAMLVSACSTTRTASIEGDFSKSNSDIETFINSVPNYKDQLNTLSGKGRALVSEPGNSDRVTIDFKANKELSLLTIQNRIGIEGGQMLVEEDSILIYNRMDKEAQKISIYDGRMTRLNELASINILDLVNYKIEAADVSELYESNNLYQFRLKNGARVYTDKSEGTVRQVIQSSSGEAPYSKIVYESYGELEGFTLPRKITIFSADERSRVVFLVRSLEINPSLGSFSIDIPDNIKIQRL